MTRLAPGGLRPALAVVLLSSVLALAGCGGSADADGPAGAATSPAGGGHDHGVAVVEGPDDTYAGVDLPEPYRRPSFTLADTTGAAYDFQARTVGKPTLLFFGYTNCPDVCPQTMADVAVALRLVEPELIEDLQVVFVTTDPAFDTPQVLEDYLDRFDGDLPVSFTGLTGDQAVIEQAQLSTGVPLAEADGRVHSSMLLLYGTDDAARVAFTSNAARDIAADLRLVVGAG